MIEPDHADREPTAGATLEALGLASLVSGALAALVAVGVVAMIGKYAAAAGASMAAFGWIARRG
jgi:hypothetical protein